MYKVNKKYKGKECRAAGINVPNLDEATQEELAAIYERFGNKIVSKVKGNGKETKETKAE